jgi:hypothetical protein
VLFYTSLGPTRRITFRAAHNSLTPRYSLSNSVIFDLLVVCRPADVLQDALAQQIGIARGGKKRKEPRGRAGLKSGDDPEG